MWEPSCTSPNAQLIAATATLQPTCEVEAHDLWKPTSNKEARVIHPKWTKITFRSVARDGIIQENAPSVCSVPTMMPER